MASSYQYIRLGEKADSAATPVAGTAMMGGGKDLDEAFRWLCKKANGGDFLVLRARGDDDYNSYVNGMCKLNSVATLIIPDLAAAEDPVVADINIILNTPFPTFDQNEDSGKLFDAPMVPPVSPTEDAQV